MAEVSPDSDEFVVELMTQCELKLHLLLEELQGKDLAAIMKEMEEEEVRPSSLNSQPASQLFEVQVVGLSKVQKCSFTRTRYTSIECWHMSGTARVIRCL